MSGKKPSAVRRCTGGTGTPSPSGAAAARAHRGWLLTVMCVGMFLVLLDVTVVNVALPTISGDLGSSLSGLQWVVDAYSVVFAALLLPAGTLGDVLGHKHMAIAGLVMFGVGSAGCGVAPGIAALIAGRGVQGVGAALL
ncbi:MAG: MFS transporter, partial [Nocardioidaceae bacterium]